ncbi:MAG: DJ-1/PfpI family protein [Ramlibacter sp.]|nr:DJ-1/PfpI family protein [Ramlibacter sp.]
MADTTLADRCVGILVFDGVEVLDFAGPFEVFGVTGELSGGQHFKASLVAKQAREYVAVNGMKVSPNETFDNHPAYDVLVVAGGSGTRTVMNDEGLIQWISRAAARAEVVLSVCSGARLLGQAGLLDGLPVATHHLVYEHLGQIAPQAILRRDARVVDTGQVVTTGGISAGIDGSFHVVSRLLGSDVARRTADYMEYRWVPDEGVLRV